MVDVNEPKQSVSDFQGMNAGLKLPQLRLNVRETLGDGRDVRDVLHGLAGVSDEESPALLRDDKAVVTQLPQGVLHRLWRDPVIPSKGADRRKSITGAVVISRPDPAPQVVRHLQVRRTGVVRIDGHPSRVSVICPGRHGTGYCVTAQCRLC